MVINCHKTDSRKKILTKNISICICNQNAIVELVRSRKECFSND